MCARIPALLWLLLLAAAPLHGQEEAASSYERQQAWFSRDKLYHFAISAAGTGALHAAGRKLGLPRGRSAVAAVLVVGAAGVWREVGTADPDDLVTRQKLSRRDLVWDAAGIAVGLAVSDRWIARRSARDAGEPLAVPPPPSATAPDGAAEPAP
ncbi:MAG TPA: hypothetical protein VGR37_09430 [Longimicrobiaceae bacterium]|nr:hypothetical protein [Longimicrobiaceae bacterium]